MIEARPGIAVVEVVGRGAEVAFEHESGGHRWQQVSPTDKHGRVHTSTVTVVVLREPEERELVLRDADLEWSTMRGSGAGGQHRNKTESAVRLVHRPTGIAVRVESERSQHQNRETALRLLRARILADRESAAGEALRTDRRRQAGCGARGDKGRTIQCQNGVVIDHATGRKIELRAYLRGDIDALVRQ